LHFVGVNWPRTLTGIFIGVLNFRIISLSKFTMLILNFYFMPVLIIMEEDIGWLEEGRCCDIASHNSS
jgi:hypothetical protein